ncbi:biorientation of chromosomes in cell division protein 1-like 1 [Ornithodoros turicata]|uniref:biorientation of chromosomes in cell division protein 1-like 1 n=1 Tax=Ornithodoros turicata TaxID=34597 RepID=UPI0031390D60
MNSDAGLRDLPPGDPKLTTRILSHLKSRGLFDELRRDCLGDVDTKPAYLNLKQRVDGYITKFLSSQTWTPDMNKNHVRDVMRREINESGMLSAGMDHLVDQIINPKIYQVFTPEVENGVRQFFGLDSPEVPSSRPHPPTIQASEQRLSEADNIITTTTALSAAAPDIDENTQDVSSAPSPKAHPRPPSPCDIISDVSSEPQLIIVTESNDHPEEDSEEPLPVPSPELETTRTFVTTSSTTTVTDSVASSSLLVTNPVTVAVTATAPVTTCITTATTSAPEETTEPSKDITASPSVVDTSEKVRKSSEDKSKRLTDDREKEKPAKKADDHRDEGARKEKKERYDDSTRSDSKSKTHGSSLSRKHSESSSRSSKSHKSRSEADASKDKKDGGHSSSDTTETKGDHCRDKGESPKPELSREKSDKEKRSSHSSSSSKLSRTSDSKSAKKKLDDRHRLQSGQHQDEKKHRRDDERSRDGHRSHSHDRKHSSEKQRSSSKDSSKPQKSSGKSTDRSSERPSQGSKDSKREKTQEKRHVEPRHDDSSETKPRPESPILALWEGRETSVQGEEILTFSYVKDRSSGGREVDLKLISATCTSEPSLHEVSVTEDGLEVGLGCPEVHLPESEEGVPVTSEDSPLKIDSRTEAGHTEESLPVSEGRKDSDLKSVKRRKSHASPRAGKRSPEKKRQKRNEDGNESEGAWSDVTVSSVHTSDLSSYDDRISLSSAEEEQEDEDSGAKEKVKISLKEIKKIASISSSNEDEDRLSKSETEHLPAEESHKAPPSGTPLPLDEKAPVPLSVTPSCQDNEGKMGLRRQRKINPKYVSEEFSSIFTEGKKPAAGTIDFSELAKYGKERHYDDRPRRIHQDSGHEARRQSVPREEVLVLPAVDLLDHGELEMAQVTPSEEGSSEPSPDRGRKPSRRLSGSVKSTSPDGSESRHRSESTSSQRYESSDLYKPRPIISSGTRRARSGVQPPTSPTSEEEPEDDEESDTTQRKKRPLKVCIGLKRGNKSPGSAAPPKKRRA